LNVGTLTGNITLQISNGFDAQIIRVTLTQDGTGSRLFTAGSNIALSADIASIVLSTAASKSDELAFRWHGGTSKARILAINKGF
jgi:hypothetical protein